MRLTRRELLGAVGLSSFGQVRGAQDVDLATGSRGPHLLLDDFIIAEHTGLRREVGTPTRLPGPVVTGPEDKCFQPYMTVLRDPETRRFRIWYGVPEHATQSHIAYMESDDGIAWERPHRVLDDPGPIQFGMSVLDEGPDFPNTRERYKLGWWHDGGLQVAASPDGIIWSKLAPGPVLTHNHDINNIFWDHLHGRYGANVSVYRGDSAWSGERRITYQAWSDDLLHWSEPRLIIYPDATDEGETQFYCMGGVIGRGDLLVGMVRVLRDDLPAEPGGDVWGLGYTTLAWSRDRETWTRDRTPFLDRNPEPGTWDRAMTWADCQLPVGDELRIYYGGYRRGHKIERFTERQIGLALMPVDRYVARVAGPSEGRLLTRQLLVAGRQLEVNADVKGHLRVAVCDAGGRPLDGYTLASCTPLRGDSVRHRVRWRRPVVALSGQPVRLLFDLRDARLYAFEWVG